MQSVLVFIVAIAWSVYLGTWMLARRERRSMNSISTFSKHLAVLGRTTPARPAAGLGLERSPGVRGVPPAPSVSYDLARSSMTLSEARDRRRQVLTTLAGIATFTAILAFALGGLFVAGHLAVDALLVAYVGLLARTQRAAVERRSTVLYLPRPVAAPTYEPALLRTSAR